MIHIESISEANADKELWDRITPHLNEALEALAQKDRDAVLLRFFQQRPFAEVGKDMGTSEEAAKMRVSRALDKLRTLFRQRGFVLGAASLAGAFSANAVTTTPVGQASMVASSALQTGGTPGAATALADSILRHLWLLRLRFWTLLAAAALGAGILFGIVAYQLGWPGQRSATPGWRPAPGQQWPQR